MSTSLSSRPSLDHETLWRAMRELVDRVFGALERDNVLDECLDVLVELLGADRGLVVVVAADGTRRAIHARRNGSDLPSIERDEISRTIVDQALQSGECVVYQPNVHTIKSVTTLGIVAALAVALHRNAGEDDGRRAVLYVDVRDQKKFISQPHVEFFMSAALLFGAVLEQHKRAEVVRAHLVEARGHMTDARRAPLLADLVGTPAMRPIADEIATALRSSASILIVGESGTGKTLLAHAIAEASGKKPIVRAMLGGSDDLNTITSELFGHERGSFSGAAGKRVGLVEFADKGTLILDELLNLPLHAQRLLLDFTQFGTYRPLGHQRPEPKKAEIRIIAATNGDLRAAIRDGRFREDLFHRLAQVVLELPPLRARRDDIPLLAQATLDRLDGGRRWSLAPAMKRMLVAPAISWSGNVRQLERVITRARDRALTRDPETREIVPEHVDVRDLEGIEPAAAAASASTGPPGPEPSSAWQQLQADRDRIDEREADVIRAVLARHGGVVAHAAKELGIARTTLASRMDALGVKRHGA